MRRRQFEVTTNEEGWTLERFLENHLKVTSWEARQLIVSGATYLQGRRFTQPDKVLTQGAHITTILEESGQKATEVSQKITAPLEVLFEDEACVVVNKPWGVTAQPTAARVGNSLLDAVSRYLGKPAGLVHRLDRDTTGVTVFGKTQQATSFLAAQFREGKTAKVYVAVTQGGLPQKGMIDLPLAADPTRPGRFRALKGAMGKPAFTEFVREKGTSEFSCVKLFPKTGRTHQLRAHLTALGFPILGDTLYGGAKEVAHQTVSRCLLHALELTVVHPTTHKSVCFQAPMPLDMTWFWNQPLD